MHRVRVLVVVLFVLAGVAAAVPAARARAAAAPPHVVDGRVADWVGDSTLLGGTSQVSRGEFVYQDNLFDDLGAWVPGKSAGHNPLENGRGTYRYPTDAERYADNAADLFQLRLAADADTVWVLGWLNTLRAPDTTVLALAVDTDRDASTPATAVAWPHGAGLSVPGADVVVTLWGSGGDVTDLRTGKVTPLADVAAGVDDNAIEAAVPRSLLGGTGWRAWAATGLWDAASGGWTAVPDAEATATSPGGGSGPAGARAFNIAFRDREAGNYMEDNQALALQSGDISAFSADVDVSQLTSAATAAYRIEPGRFYAAMVRESFDIGPLREGMSYTGVTARGGGIPGVLDQQVTFNYLGRWQPYGVYLPKAWDATVALPGILMLHGASGSYSSFNRFPGAQRDLGDNQGSAPTILVAPLARGGSFFVDYGEADVLEVLDDATRRFNIDPERLYDAGYSMGGYGMWRMAVLYPDRFAGAVAWAGFTGEYLGASNTENLYGRYTGDPGGIKKDVYDPNVAPYLEPDPSKRDKPVDYLSVTGDPVQVLENLRYLPVLQLVASNDEIVSPLGQYEASKRLDQLGYRHRFDLYPGYEHLTFALVDDWKVPRAWLGDTRRVTRPRRVTYRFSEAWNDPAIPLGLAHDKAWWVSALRQRSQTGDPFTYGAVDAVSGARREPTATPRTYQDAAALPTPNVRTGTAWDLGPPPDLQNRLDVTFTDVRAATVDAAAAGLRSRCLAVALTTDGPTTLTLTGLRRAPVLAGAGATVAWARGRAVVTVAAAGHVLLTDPRCA